MAELGGHRAKCCVTEFMPAVGFVAVTSAGTDASLVEDVEYELMAKSMDKGLRC